MDYKFIFEDGSECLAHYGIKGMKWGRWNAETQARYAGAGNGTYYRKAQYGSEYGKSVTDLRRAYNANQPKSKQIVKNILLTPGGAHAYNTARSRGLSRSDALHNSPLGVLYAQGVKQKQKRLGTTDAKVSKAAKERSDYTKKEKLGKTAAKEILTLGGTIAYNSVKARTKSRGKAALAAIGAHIVTGAAASTGSSLLALPGVIGYATATDAAGVAAAVSAANAGSELGKLGASYTPNALARLGRDSDRQVSASKFKKRTPEKKKNGKARW